MCLKYYNLTLNPFDLSPDPKFLWLSEKHKEALAAMKYGILHNKGFISLTGNVGTGKTTLVNALANSLGDNVIFAQVPDPFLEQLDFFNSVADAFGINQKFSTKGDFLIHLRHFLNNAYDHQQEVVLVIEEAQRFDQERLEEVRLISNIEKPDKKLINIVFVGQNKFNSILKKNKSLRQQVAIIHNIVPLQEIETGPYVDHRLKIAGSEKKIFSPEAVHEIYSFSEGNPRLINIICDLALLTGYAQEKKIIEPEIIRECAASCLLSKQQKEDATEDLSASSKSIPETGTGEPPGTSGNSYQIVAQKMPQKPAGHKLAYVTTMFVVILLGLFGYLYFFGENHAPYRNLKTFLAQAFDRYTGSKSETSSQKPDEITKRQSSIAGTQDQGLDLKTQKASIDTQLVQLRPRNKELTAKLENDIEKTKNEIAELQGQFLDLKAQKASSENQLEQIRFSFEELTADIQELKGVKERVAVLKGELATRDQALFKSEQKVTDLTSALDREKKGQDLLRAELSTKADLVAELQQKLTATLASGAALENDIEKSQNEIAQLQGQLLDLKAQKASSKNQLEQMRSSNEKLTADLNELKGAKERVAALEGELASRDQTLSRSEQKLAELAEEFDREKTSKEMLNSELSMKADLVAELQQKLAASLSSGAELENDIEKSRKEIAVLQNQLGELKTQQAPIEFSPVKEIAVLQGQLLDLKAQKASSETQLGQLRSRYDELSADLDELNGAKERIAALEGELASRDQTLSQSEQKLAELAEELDREKTSGKLLGSELSSKVDLIAELQEKLGNSQSDALEFKAAIENSTVKINELQEQLSNLKSEKASAETQLGRLRSSYDELTTDLNELKGEKERVAALEGVAARREQTLSQSEQKITDLTSALDREKKVHDLLRAELSTKAAQVAELQQKLEDTLFSRAVLENDSEKSRKEIAELQNQLRELNPQQSPTESSPVIVDVKKKSASKSEASAEQGESPSPSDIIDWILKTKAK